MLGAVRLRTASSHQWSSRPMANAKHLTPPESKSWSVQASQVDLSRLERRFILVAHPAQEHLGYLLPRVPGLQIRRQCANRLRVARVHWAFVGTRAEFGKAATAIARRRAIRFREVLRLSREPAPYSRCCGRQGFDPQIRAFGATFYGWQLSTTGQVQPLTHLYHRPIGATDNRPRFIRRSSYAHPMPIFSAYRVAGVSFWNSVYSPFQDRGRRREPSFW
jgi:hypothetical protein